MPPCGLIIPLMKSLRNPTPACILLILSLGASDVAAQDFFRDSLFADTGFAVTDFTGNTSDQARQILIQTDGKIIVGGTSFTGGDDRIAIARYDACGELDLTFGDSGRVHHTFYTRSAGVDYALQPDGKIIVVGNEQQPDPNYFYSSIARFNSNGTPDVSFGSGGVASLTWPNAGYWWQWFDKVFVLPSGKLLVTGGVGNYSMGAMRFNADGSLDTTFGNQGVAQKLIMTMGRSAAVLQPDGKVIVINALSGAGGNYRIGLLRFNTDGTPDNTFGTAGYAEESSFSVYFPSNYVDARLTSDGKILVGCSVNPSPDQRMQVARFNSNGTLDLTFGTNGLAQIHFETEYNLLLGMAVDAAGRILVCGENGGTGAVGSVMGRFNADGSIDSTFGINGREYFDFTIGGTNWVQVIKEMSDGRLLIGGWDYASSNQGDWVLLRYTSVHNVPHVSFSSGILTSTGSGTFQWYLNGSPVSGAIANTYVPQVDGDYSVLLTDADGCTWMSDLVTLTGVGIGEHHLNGLLAPNPATDVMMIRLDEYPAGVRVFSTNGVLVKNLVVQNSVAVDVSDLQPGSYFVTITSARGSYKNCLVKVATN